MEQREKASNREKWKGITCAALQELASPLCKGSNEVERHLPGVSNMLRRYDLLRMSCVIRVMGIDRILTPR